MPRRRGSVATVSGLPCGRTAPVVHGPPIELLAWLLALLLSASTGSATVGIVSSTGIVAPLVTGDGSWYLSLVVVAIGAGSIGLNYVNHAGFWLVKESFGMTMGQAVKIHTSVQTLVSVIAFIVVLILSIFV